MIKTCSTGHNEVCWEHSNHPNGCPVCSQIARVKDYEPYMTSCAASKMHRLESEVSDLTTEKMSLTCKLRDANIEIERLKNKLSALWDDPAELCQKCGLGWKYEATAKSNLQMQEEIEKLKKDIADTVERSNFAIREDGRNIRIAVERGRIIKELEKKIFHLEGQLKAAWDHSLSFKSVGPMEKGEVDVMKDDYFKMKKQRDDLLVKVEELEKMDRSSAASGTLMAAKQKIFTLESQVCDLLEQNARITMNAQMKEDGYLIQEIRRLNARIEELLVEMEKQA